MVGFGASSSGLQCSWGSTLDERIPRAKMPKSALPPDVRAKLGFKRKVKGDENGGDSYWKPGFGNNEVVRGKSDTYHAGNQRKFLKRGSGKAMSARASRAAQLRNSGRAVLGGRPAFNASNGHVAATRASVSTKMINSSTGRNTAAMAAPRQHPECRQPVNKPPRGPGTGRTRRRRPRPAQAAGAHSLDAAPQAGQGSTNQELSPGALGRAQAAQADADAQAHAQAAQAARTAAARVSARKKKLAARASALAATPQGARAARRTSRNSSVRKPAARRQSAGGTWR